MSLGCKEICSQLLSPLRDLGQGRKSSPLTQFIPYEGYTRFCDESDRRLAIPLWIQIVPSGGRLYGSRVQKTNKCQDILKLPRYVRPLPGYISHSNSWGEDTLQPADLLPVVLRTLGTQLSWALIPGRLWRDSAALSRPCSCSNPSLVLLQVTPVNTQVHYNRLGCYCYFGQSTVALLRQIGIHSRLPRKSHRIYGHRLSSALRNHRSSAQGTHVGKASWAGPGRWTWTAREVRTPPFLQQRQLRALQAREA